MNTQFLAQIPGIDNPVVKGLKGASSDSAPAKFGTWIAAIVAILLILGSIWALFQLLIGAIQWISSGGDADKVSQAQGKMRDAIVGVIVLFASWAVYLVIINWLGIGSGSSGSINFTFPTLF